MLIFISKLSKVTYSFNNYCL